MTHSARNTTVPIVQPGKRPYCGPLPVKLGETVPYFGMDWVVTGWDVRRNAIYIARGLKMNIVTPIELGMMWK